MKRSYFPQAIKAIPIDPNQVLLQVCQIGGAYLAGPGPTFNCATPGSMGNFCIRTPKGSLIPSILMRSTGTESFAAAS